MTKHDFVSFVSGELRQGAVRFSLAFNSKGEIVLHWTNKAGIRVWRILSGNRGKKPSKANLERMSNFRRWLFDARQGMEGYTQQPEQSMNSRSPPVFREVLSDILRGTALALPARPFAERT